MRVSRPNAQVICHSKAPNGEELITMEIELHRFILPEFNTHRVFSRNFQSSRAVPVEKMIEQVRTNPAMPVHWGKNQRGMVAETENDNLIITTGGIVGQEQTYTHTKEDWWKKSAEIAAYRAEKLHEAGYHKQIVNRLLEPFMWTKGVVTATKEGFDSFFQLRLHKDAQPEIQALAKKMYKAITRSEPDKLDYGDYHLPYIYREVNYLDGEVTYPKLGSDILLSIEEAIKISTSCTAQVSYRVLDDSLEKALKIYDMLNLPVRGVYPGDPPHYSPTEHVAKVVEDFEHEDFMSGNFVTGTFWQYRKALEMGQEEKFIGEL